MSRRRARRMRPATTAEQQRFREFAARLDEVLDAPTLDARREAYGRMRRLTERISDPDNLTHLSAAELHDALTQEHQKADYGAPQTGRNAPDFRPVRGR